MTIGFYGMTKLITDRLAANYSGLPIVLDNDDAAGITKTNGFVYFSVVTTKADPATINGANPKYRTIGYIRASFMLPDNIGQKQALQLADTFSDIYRAKSFNSVFCYTPFIDNGKKVEYNNANYYNLEWYCPFRFDEHIPL